MKLLSIIIGVVLLVVMTRPAGAYDFNQAWKYLWQASSEAASVLRVENRELQAIVDTVPALEESLASVTVQLTEQAETIEAQDAKIKDLIPRAVLPEALQGIRNSIDDLSGRLVSLRVHVAEQNALLSKAITKTQWIETAYCIITTRRFDTSNSMAPYIQANDLVFVCNNPPTEIINRGDVIGSVNPACFYAHRIVGGNSTDGWIIKGDNRGVADDCRVMPNQILFRVEYVVRGFYS